MALVCFLLLADNVYARCNPLYPSTCVPNKVKNTVYNTANGVSRVFVHNKCQDYVSVKVEYQDTKKGKYFKEKNFSFSPGENAYLVNSLHRYVYITAQSSRVSSRNNFWKRKRIDLGRYSSDYTYTITCR